MKVMFGTTRYVVILKNWVIKIPRIPVILFFVRFIKCCINKSIKNKIKKHENNLWHILSRYFLGGFIANYIEYKYSRKNPNSESIIPIYFLIFGIIAIQPRGYKFNTCDKRWKKILRKNFKKNIGDSDMFTSINYSLWNGKIRLHDYGSMLTTKALAK